MNYCFYSSKTNVLLFSSRLVLPHIMCCYYCQCMFKGGGGGHISYNRYSTITISKQHFAKAGKNKSSSAFHIACEQLNVYPGLKMHCYLRVWTPPPIPVIPAGGPGRGDQKLTWSGHKQKCLSSSKVELNTTLELLQYVRLSHLFVAVHQP